MTSQRRGAIFGRNLQQACQSCRGGVPEIFTESLALLQEGISNPDLFAGKADRKKVCLLQKAWDQGKNPLKLTKTHDFCAVSECLLKWLNSLPSPIIPCRLFHAFLHVHQTCSHSQWTHQLHALFEKLETHESEVAISLLSFLHNYDQYHRGKSFRNPSLGQIFGPTLLKAHDQALPLPYPEDTRAAAALVDCMIADHDLIFRPAQSPSPCSSPVKKPPSRAKTSPVRKEMTSFSGSANIMEEKKKQQFAARMIRLDDAPVKHLRINTASSERLQDENCEPMNGRAAARRTLSSVLLEDNSCNPDAPSAFRLTSEEDLGEEEDTELDKVVGTLLCGSLSGMLFEPDDQKFLERTSSLMSTSSPSVSCYQSEMSVDLSSDEELVQFCP